MLKVLVTGGKGYIASLINLYNTQFDMTLIGREELDLSDTAAVRKYMAEADFDILVHAGAASASLTCEQFPELSHKVNVDSTKVITDVCKSRGKRLVFISTEQVFNGLDHAGPHREDVRTRSVSVYGRQKIECEEYIGSADLDCVVLRFSWMFGLAFPGVRLSYNILTQVIKAMMYDIPAFFTVNEMRGFTYAHNVARQFADICGLARGVYHISAENKRSTYEAAVEIARIMGFSGEAIGRNILPDTGRYADRFRDYRLDNAKVKHCGISFGSLEREISQCLEDFCWIRPE